MQSFSDETNVVIEYDHCSLAIALQLRSIRSVNEIYVTDGSEAVIPLIKHNIHLNRLDDDGKASITASRLSWGEDTPDGIPNQPDILLAADCVYFEPAFPLLLKSMVEMIGVDSICYFCCKYDILS